MTHMFDMRCRENGIEHRLTRIKHPWTNGQVERMNQTIKEATVKRYHYDSHAQLTAHPSSSYANAGQMNPNDSSLTRTIKCWDQTTRGA